MGVNRDSDASSSGRHVARRKDGVEDGEHIAVESAEIDAIPLDARLHVLDEGSPVRWVSISETDHPFYPAGVTRLFRSPALITSSRQVVLHIDSP